MIMMYEYKTELFVSLFCENKNHPQLHCNGHCRFAKMQNEEGHRQHSKAPKKTGVNLYRLISNEFA